MIGVRFKSFRMGLNTCLVKAVDKCFIWKSTRTEVALARPLFILPDKTQCSRHEVVTSETDATTRLNAVVLAEELISGH